MVNKENDENNGVSSGFHFRQPNTDTKWEKFQKAIYNPSTKEILGRTGKNWGQLFLFYAIFYVVLAALFAICMQGLFASLSDTEPTWTLDRSLIGTNPGVGFRPISERTEEGSLIKYKFDNDSSADKWKKLLDDFLEPYNTNQSGDNFVDCNFNKKPENGSVCSVKLDTFGKCGPSNNYGYGNNSKSPCVFLKLNKIYGWQPEFYTEPIDEMPQDLKDDINKLKAANQSEQVWISCQGERENDKENLSKFNYYPNRGIPGYYFPYKNIKNYLSPLIAVEVVTPKQNIVVNIECRAWAKNINYRGGDLQREGSIHFEILQD